jgi:excisionase family DNA binding protein
VSWLIITRKWSAAVSDKDFLSVEEVAKRLGLKEETIRTYIREGSLNAYRFGNVLRVRVDDFEKFVQERRIRRDEDK